ncbi:MAG: hypothetical protein ACUVTD_08765 [Nitrososphaerales archaeon]
MARPAIVDGNVWLKIRVSKQFYELIKEIAGRCGLTVSETCRSALEFAFMGLFLKRLGSIEKEFMERYGKKKSS